MKLRKRFVVLLLPLLLCSAGSTGCSRALRDGAAIGVTDGVSDGIAAIITAFLETFTPAEG